MSGQQIGSFVGGVIGAYFGGPMGYAIGSAIGGAIGGYVDPTIIKGPRLSDATAQTAQDGIPIPFGFGTFPTSGNIIFASPLRERKKEDDGKGTGIVNVTYHYYRSYAIGICQGIRQDDGTYADIAGILQVKRNGKVVYNTLPTASSEELAQNGKFLQKAIFYLGGETQLPSPMMEGFKGAGNVPAYRGLVYMTIEDEELTDMGGAVPQYDFVVVTEGVVEPFHQETIAAGRLSRFTNADFPLTDGGFDYEYTGVMEPFESFTADSIQEVVSHFTMADRSPINYLGYSAETTATISDGIGYDLAQWGVSNFVAQPVVDDNIALKLVYNDYYPDTYTDALFLSATCGSLGADQVIQTRRGELGRKFTTNPGGSWGLGQVCGDGTFVYGLFPLVIHVTRKRIAPAELIPPTAVPIPDAPGYYVLPNGEVVAVPGYEEVFGDFRVLNLTGEVELVDDRQQYSFYENGPAVEFGDPNYNNQAFWESQYDLAVDEGLVPAGWTFDDQYPAAIGSVFRSAVTDSDLITRDLIPVAQCVAAICKRAGLTEDDFDVASITDLVDGFKVATEGSGESFIAPLMNGFFFDAGEWDDKVRFITRGIDVLGEIGPDDLCERDGQVIEETELQEVELLRKVNIKAIDPDAGFNITTQTAERRTTTVKAKGEQTTEIPVVIDHDTQARMADKRLKAAWSEIRRFAFTLPYIFPQYTVTDVLGLTDKKGRRQRIRLMEMGEEVGQIGIREAMLDRQSAYTSDVEGTAHQPPTDTSPGLIGPTNGVALNLPSLRTSDNVPGMYIGGHGYLTGWSGASVLLSVDGGATYENVGDITDPTTMGIITEDIGAGTEPIPVDMYSGTLSSITEAQLADRRNAFAIVTDGVAEVGQFQIATPTPAPAYDLTNVIRGALTTEAVPHDQGDPFVMVARLQFLPLDISLAGRTLFFKFVSYGTAVDDAIPYEVVFNPLFTSVTIEAYVNESGDIYRDGNNSTYYRIS